ncbi:MAG: bleomycin resistance family protein [Acidobacteria bacterium]|nr:MAG: bleomycin resistance family protein [Acidobacteriota bacterium]
MIGSKDQNMNDFESVIPILSVKNFTASIDYYVNKLGFEKRWDWGDPPTFGCVGRGKIDIFLCEGAQGQPGMWMSIFLEDVDALYDEYKKSGAIIRQPPTNYPWGVREMNVEDVDGHRLRMGSESTGPADDGAHLDERQSVTADNLSPQDRGRS